MQAVMCYTGLLAFIAFVKNIKKNVVLNFIGQNTLTILALHIMVQSLLRGILFKFFHVAPEMLESSLVAGLAMTAVTLLALVPAILIINRFVPWLSGKSRIAKP